MAKTLKEALEEMDRWAKPLNETLSRMHPDDWPVYFQGATERLEKATGIKLDLPVQKPPTTDEVFRHFLEQGLHELVALLQSMRVALGRLSPEAQAAFRAGPMAKFEKRAGIKLNLEPAAPPRAARAG